MISDLKVNKPEPITSGKPTASLERSTDVELTIEILEAGKPVLISAFYSDGLTLIRELQYHLGRELNNETYREKRHFRSEFHRLSYFNRDCRP